MMKTRPSKKNSGAGNPQKRDPKISRLHKTMESAVILTRDLKDDLSEEHYEWLRASALGLMVAYSDLTGLPSPLDYIEMDAAWAEKPAEEKSLCPICKNTHETIGKTQCFACGVDYS